MRLLSWKHVHMSASTDSRVCVCVCGGGVLNAQIWVYSVHEPFTLLLVRVPVVVLSHSYVKKVNDNMEYLGWGQDRLLVAPVVLKPEWRCFMSRLFSLIISGTYRVTFNTQNISRQWQTTHWPKSTLIGSWCITPLLDWFIHSWRLAMYGEITSLSTSDQCPRL